MIVEARLNLQQRREEYQKEVRSQLAEAQVKAATLEQQLNSAQFELQHSEILAPADGIAVNLGVHTEGAVVRAGDTLLEIVPQGTALEVEGRLPVNLVDKVALQLPVDILFTAFNQNRTPRVSGEVALVSADQLIDERTGQPYYSCAARSAMKRWRVCKACPFVRACPPNCSCAPASVRYSTTCSNPCSIVQVPP